MSISVYADLRDTFEKSPLIATATSLRAPLTSSLNRI
jgi:hypothetical protein